MAEIKDGEYTYIGGTVKRVFQTKNGAAFELHFQKDRDKYPTRYTVWGLGDQVAEGDRVKVSGFPSQEIDEYEKDGQTKRIVKRSLNSPKLEAHEPGNTSQTPPAPAGDVWGAGNGSTEDVPW